MLPRRLHSQNPTGIILFFARSEAIHWRKNRTEKTALPVHPTIFQGVTTIKANTAEWINHSIRGYRIDWPD
jgi:hypothetical protein